MLTLQIGRKHTVEVESLVEASRMYCRLRDDAGDGARTFPEGKVIGLTDAYRISYNGRVWRGKWHEGQKPVMEAQA